MIQQSSSFTHSHTHIKAVKSDNEKYTLSVDSRKSTTSSTKRTKPVKWNDRELHFRLLRNFASSTWTRVTITSWKHKWNFSMYPFRRTHWRHFLCEEANLFAVELCDTLHRIYLINNAPPWHLAQKTLSCSCAQKGEGVFASCSLWK